MSDPIDVVNGAIENIRVLFNATLDSLKVEVDKMLVSLLSARSVPPADPVLLYTPMTSNVLPFPQVASATSCIDVPVNQSGLNLLPWKAFNGVGGAVDGWAAAAVPTVEAPQCLEIDLGAETQISYYNLQNCWTTDPNFGYNFGTWKLQGSHNGTDWNDLDSVVGDTNDVQYAWKFSGYGKAVSGTYRYYRIYCTGLTPGLNAGLGCCQFVLYGSSS